MKKMAVLVVEDKVYPEGEALKSQVSALGYDVIGIAATAEEAIAACKKTRPEIVLMDIQLRDPDTGSKDDTAGARAAQIIQRETAAQIIYITQFGSVASVLDEVSRTRDFQFLHKPVSDLQLSASLRLAALKAARKTIVFLCYSHEDSAYAEELQKFFRPLADVGIDLWSDRRIGPGRLWKDEIGKALDAASTAVCLVSIDFVNSDFITRFELPRLFKAAESRGTLIVPAFLRQVPRAVLDKHQLMGFQGINSPSKVMAGLKVVDREACWARLADSVERQMSANAQSSY